MFAKNVHGELRKSTRRAIFVRKTPRRAVNATLSRSGYYTEQSRRSKPVIGLTRITDIYRLGK